MGDLLADDHRAVDKILTRLHSALKAGDAGGSHATLDLFWARLAVHIRAEHLHLFPTVITRVKENTPAEPTLTEAESTVEELRADHDFFMHQLARAVEIARTRTALEDIGKIIVDVEQRLRRHNLLEEQKIYRWVGTLLNQEEQAQLAREIQKELANRPQRFAETDW